MPTQSLSSSMNPKSLSSLLLPHGKNVCSTANTQTMVQKTISNDNNLTHNLENANSLTATKHNTCTQHLAKPSRQVDIQVDQSALITSHTHNITSMQSESTPIDHYPLFAF